MINSTVCPQQVFQSNICRQVQWVPQGQIGSAVLESNIRQAESCCGQKLVHFFAETSETETSFIELNVR
jgi:hypothetical protein